jgi:hypothetical protein
MNVYFTQIYIEPGVRFPFSHHFQRYLSKEITALVSPSPLFLARYGSDFRLHFNVSAKPIILECEIRGPSVFRKTKDVEFTVFLPFDVIARDSNVLRSALNHLLGGVYSVLERLGIDAGRISANQDGIVNEILSNAIMVKERDWTIDETQN